MEQPTDDGQLPRRVALQAVDGQVAENEGLLYPLRQDALGLLLVYRCPAAQCDVRAVRERAAVEGQAGLCDPLVKGAER